MGSEVRTPPHIRREEGQAFLVDETYAKVGSFEAWVWVAVEPIHRFILGVYLSRHQNSIVAELFLKGLVERYGKHAVYSDGGTWHPEACAALGLKHRLHSSYEKSLMERVNQYLEDRIEEFDDYYPCMKKECDLTHVRNWLNLFVDINYARRRHIDFGGLLRFLGGKRRQVYTAPSPEKRDISSALET